MTYLAGDIGGTKTHLALYDKTFKRLASKRYASQEYGDLRIIIKEFLAEFPHRVSACCLGIAGPIREGRCEATNLPWVIDSRVIGQDLQTNKVRLLNDLEANGYGIKRLGPSDFFVLNEGSPVGGHQVLISAGTGLGEAGLYFDGKDHIPVPTEGGHCDFAPRNEREFQLLIFLQKRFGVHISYERILSGPGLLNLYHYCVEIEGKTRDKEIDAATESVAPKLISEKGMKRENAVCREVLEWFVSLYGCEAGNLFLKYLAMGGVFIGGGIAPKILELLKGGVFLNAFCAKGRFDKLLRQAPIKVILNEETALLGAAHVATLLD